MNRENLLSSNEQIWLMQKKKKKGDIIFTKDKFGFTNL